MNRNFWINVVPGFVALAALGFIGCWVGGGSDVVVEIRVPGADETPEGAGIVDEPTKLVGTLVKSSGKPGDIAGAWPWFRGSGFDIISDDADSTLMNEWPAGGPKELWAVDVGEGYAGAAILGGCVYLVDYDRETVSDSIRCLSLEDGAEIWRYSYPVKVTYNHGMSRTVPAVTDKYLVAIGPMCHVTCLDRATGEFKWMLNLPKEFGTEVPLWYAGQCPFIEDGKVILAPGGDCLMMAVDCETGEVVWKTPNPHKWAMTHTSITPMEFGGKKMYVYAGGGGVCGVSVEDGSLLWETTEWKMRTNVPSPVVVGADKLFLSGGYGNGSMMLKLVESEGVIAAVSEFRLEPEVFGSEQHTPIFYKGYIYGVRPDWQLVCLDLEGNEVWTSTSANSFKRLGPFMIANGLLYVMDGDGKLTLVEATSVGFMKISESQVLDGIESWGPMAIASGRLVVRDLKRMVCISVSK